MLTNVPAEYSKTRRRGNGEGRRHDPPDEANLRKAALEARRAVGQCRARVEGLEQVGHIRARVVSKVAGESVILVGGATCDAKRVNNTNAECMYLRPVPELSVTSSMVPNCLSTTGTLVKISRSVMALGPVKQFSEAQRN